MARPSESLLHFITPFYHEYGITYFTSSNINVTKVIDAFGITDLANPLEAHVAYDQDDRVVALIARGIGTEHSLPLVKQRCEFTKIIE